MNRTVVVAGDDDVFEVKLFSELELFLELIFGYGAGVFDLYCQVIESG